MRNNSKLIRDHKYYIYLNALSEIKAATHLVPNPFDPRTSGPPLSVPMDNWSQKIWSPWTNGPQPIWSPWTNGPHQIWSPWTNGPQKFGPPGQMVPNQFGPQLPYAPHYNPLLIRNRSRI